MLSKKFLHSIAATGMENDRKPQSSPCELLSYWFQLSQWHGRSFPQLTDVKSCRHIAVSDTQAAAHWRGWMGLLFSALWRRLFRYEDYKICLVSLSKLTVHPILSCAMLPAAADATGRLSFHLAALILSRGVFWLPALPADSRTVFMFRSVLTMLGRRPPSTNCEPLHGIFLVQCAAVGSKKKRANRRRM